MSIMGEPSYHHPPGRGQLYPQDWTTPVSYTPHSTVSSFNFPQHVDSTLITPISTTMSPPQRTPPIKQRPPSPPIANHPYQFFSGEEDYSTARPKSPMRYKNPLAPLPISTTDSSFPLSPLECPSPYWGPFGVSAPPTNLDSTSHPSHPSHSSPSMSSSPIMTSNDGIQSSARWHHEQPLGQAASTYRPQNQTPILIAPNPKTLRPSNRHPLGPHRQNSLDSGLSTPASAHVFQRPGQSPFLLNQDLMGSQTSRRKRKSPSRTGDDDSTNSNPERSDRARQDTLLVQLRVTEGLQWKEVMERFNEITGLSMKVPALEMRLKRHRERSRPWTEVDDNALALSYAQWNKDKWKNISDGMLQHGVSESWTKEVVKKKWEEHHPEHKSPQASRRRKRTSREREASVWSEGSLSLHSGDGEALMSTGGMNDLRNRLASDHRAHFQQTQQHQVMFEQGQ